MTNYANQHAVLSVIRSGTAFIDGILYGRKWGEAAITYSFPNSTTDFVANYLGLEPNGFSAAISSIQQSVTTVLDKQDGNPYNNGFSVEGFTNLEINFGSDDTTTALRFSMSSTIGFGSEPSAAVGRFISDEKFYKTCAGDVWFSTVSAGGSNNQQQIPGQQGYLNVLHEIGHVLGLKHTHDDGGTDWPLMPDAYHGHSYTVMSYRTMPGYANTYSSDEVQSFMPADIAALQYLYGADFNTNNSNTVYSWQPGVGTTFVNNGAAIVGSEDYVWATIWDGGGVDTYDLSAFITDTVVDLRAGGLSSFTAKAFQFPDSITGARVFAPGNIANAYRYDGDDRSLIENAITSGGNDILIGNQGNNTLTGGAGADLFILRNAWGVDTITDFEDGVDLVQIERKNNEPTVDQLLNAAVQQGGMVVITYLDMKIKLSNFDLNDLSASDFIII